MLEWELAGMREGETAEFKDIRFKPEILNKL